jgi:threonine dehydratase
MITLEAIYRARQTLTGIAAHTPLLKNANLSERHSSGVWLKREDLQPVRSYKLRGAYNKIATLPPEQQAAGVVCASAGNHAQGVAFACQHLNIRGTIVMPVTTPQQKIRQVNWFGKQTIEIVLSGDTFDEAYATASLIALEQKKNFHPPL